jgi:hypothetical protein
MKKLLCVIILLLLGCDMPKKTSIQPPSPTPVVPKFLVAGTVSHKPYISMGTSASNSEYVLKLKAVNAGDEDVLFDTIKISYVTDKRGSLTNSVVRVEKGENGKNKPKIVILKKGESHEFEGNTNGYTGQLTGDGGEIQAQIRFYLAKQLIQGSTYVVDLPLLKDMELSIDGKTGQAVIATAVPARPSDLIDNSKDPDLSTADEEKPTKKVTKKDTKKEKERFIPGARSTFEISHKTGKKIKPIEGPKSNLDNGVHVVGAVAKHHHTSMSSNPMVSDTEYKLDITIKNEGKIPITFDQISCVFTGENESLTCNYSKNANAEKALKDPTFDTENFEPETIVLEPGQEFKHHAESDGYTYFILGKELQVQLRLRYRDNPTSDFVFVAKLPDIKGLPYSSDMPPRGMHPGERFVGQEEDGKALVFETLIDTAQEFKAKEPKLEPKPESKPQKGLLSVLWSAILPSATAPTKEEANPKIYTGDTIQSQIQVTGKAYAMHNMMPATVQADPTANLDYFLRLQLKNNGPDPIKFDRIACRFATPGSKIDLTIIKNKVGKNDPETIVEKNDPETIVLAAGQTHNCVVTTMGRSIMLGGMTDIKRQVQLCLVLENKFIGVAHVAELPIIMAVPTIISPNDDKEKGYELKFKTFPR